jgi:hypothetical protein
MGTAEVLRRLSKVIEKFPKVVMRALRQEAELDMTESKKRCPVYSPPIGGYVDHVGGTLRASGHVLDPVRKGSMMSVDMVYGGAAEAYAVIQHESLDFHHNVGEAKYLESVVLESAPYLRARVASRIRLTEDMLQ